MMNATSLLAGGCLTAAAAAAACPASIRRARRRLTAISRSTPAIGGPGGRGMGWRSAAGRLGLLMSVRRPEAERSGPAGRRAVWAPVLVGTGLLGCAVAVAVGPIAGLAAGAYGGLAIRTVGRRRCERAAAQARVWALDALCGLAADLRAGMPVVLLTTPLITPLAASPGPAGPLAASALATGTPPSDAAVTSSPEAAWARAQLSIAEGDPRLGRLVEALRRLADQTGAPLADLLERVEADARALDRIRALAAAQSAGTRATAWLLAALPAGGIALGYGIGADPLRVLLHTPLGAGCACGAIALQLAGLAWAGRIGRFMPIEAQGSGAPATTGAA
jgi:tight adherence protein B